MRRFWVLGLAVFSMVHAQVAPTATIGFAKDLYYVSEMDPMAFIETQYIVMSVDPRNQRGPSDNVGFRALPGTATTPFDFEGMNVSIFFDGGQGTHLMQIKVPIKSDSLAEEDETVLLELGPGTGATTLLKTNATLIILDSSVGKARFATTNLAASEAAGEVAGTLMRDGGTRGEIEVEVYAWTLPGPGMADYSDSDQSVPVKFADGQNQATFRLKLTKDSAVEGTEHLTLKLRDARQGAWVTNSELDVVIQDDSIEAAQTENGIVISWASPCDGCELQSSAEVSSAGWEKVQAQPTEAEGRFTLSEASQGGQKFYRLKR